MDLQFCPGAVVMVFVATLVAAFITSGGVRLYLKFCSRHFSPSRIVIETHEQILADPLFSQVCGRLDQEGCCQEADPGDYIDSINARSASGLRIMVQRFFNSMMP